MNWFQRYGIPGAYFIGLTIIYVYTLYYYMIPAIDPKVLITIAFILFIPIGYIISILQQWLYLHIKHLGIHRAAKNKAKVDFSNQPDDEPTIEAHSILLVMDARISIDQHKILNEWIRRRMDVISINFTIIIATILSIIVAFVIPKFFLQWSIQCVSSRIWCLIAISIFVVLVMFFNMIKLRKQVILTIASKYEKYK